MSGDGVTEKVVWQMLKPSVAVIGVPNVAPHDLRRTTAKLCRAAGGELEQIQLLLWRSSVQTSAISGDEAKSRARTERWDQIECDDWQGIAISPPSGVSGWLDKCSNAFGADLEPAATRMDTFRMTLKSASLLALAGVLLMTILVAVNFFNTIVGVSRGIIPAMAIVPCLVYFLAGIFVSVFLWVFNRSQG